MWRTVPVARLLLPFLVGILGAYFLMPPGGTDRWLVPVLLFFWLCLLPGWYRGQSGRYRSFFATGVFIWLGLAGVVSYVQATSEGATRFPLDQQTQSFFLAKVREIERRSGKSDRLSVALLANGPALDSLYRNRQALLFYLRDSLPCDPGDTILVRGGIRPVPPPGNPEAFDYRFYLFTRGVRFQVFVEQAYPLVRGRPSVSLVRFMDRWRTQLGNRLVQDTESAAVAAVSLALVMGQKKTLTEEIREAYARAGAMHVLAVSGLHVGIIALFVQRILGFFAPAGRTRKRLRVVGGIIAVWVFALLTGAAASVVRAAIMFSLFMLGQLYRTRAGVWNNILAAALIMLCVQPLYIFQLGFQLSFIAVAGIVFFYPHLNRLVYSPTRAVTYLWQLLCVGLAAQLVTAPLTVYHFGQFPLLFWLSGWVVIPLATLILASGLLKMALLSVPILGDLTVRLLNIVTALMNRAMHLIAEHPMAVKEELSLPFVVVIAIYFSLLVAMVSWRFLPQWRFGSGWPILFALCALCHYQWTIRQQRMVVFYRVDEEFMVDIIEGRRVITICPPGVSAASRHFAASGFRQKRSLLKPREITVDQAHFIDVNAGTMRLGWQWSAGAWPHNDSIAFDVVVVMGGPPPPASTLLTPATQVFLGPGLSPKYRTEWQKRTPHHCQYLRSGYRFVLPPNF